MAEKVGEANAGFEAYRVGPPNLRIDPSAADKIHAHITERRRENAERAAADRLCGEGGAVSDSALSPATAEGEG